MSHGQLSGGQTSRGQMAAVKCRGPSYSKDMWTSDDYEAMNKPTRWYNLLPHTPTLSPRIPHPLVSKLYDRLS